MVQTETQRLNKYGTRVKNNRAAQTIAPIALSTDARGVIDLNAFNMVCLVRRIFSVCKCCLFCKGGAAPAYTLFQNVIVKRITCLLLNLTFVPASESTHIISETHYSESTNPEMRSFHKAPFLPLTQILYLQVQAHTIVQNSIIQKVPACCSP